MLPKNFKFILKFLLFILMINKIVQCDYIRSNELILNDNIEVQSELINLNKLINNEKQINMVSGEKTYLFKLVNDTQLVNYVELKYLNSETTLLALSRKINIEEICPNAEVCTQTLKIIAVNENDFIEIPVEIRRVKQMAKLNISFAQEVLNLNATKLTNTYLIHSAFLTQEFAYLNQIIQYKIDKNIINKDYFDFSISKISAEKLKLIVNFKNETLFMKAYDSKLIFEVNLRAILNNTLSEAANFEADDKILKINIRVEANELIPLEPLSFEQPIYSIAIENALDEDQSIALIRPKLKEFNNNQEIFFSIFQSETSTSLYEQEQFPFSIDSNTGIIGLKRDQLDDLFISEKLYSFGIKATYKKLINKNKESGDLSSSANYYQDYMIPAFAKVQISFKHKSVKAPIVHHEILSPFVSKYEILNEESTNKTFILFINDPIELNSRLVKLSLETDVLSQIKWDVNDIIEGIFEFKIESNYIVLSNKIEFKDQRVYRTTVKIINDKKSFLKTSRTSLLSEIHIEFRIDFDPLLFERNEYDLNITPNYLVNQNLVKISVKQSTKTKKYKTLDYSKGVTYRFTVEDEFFDIHPTIGWISAKKALNTTKSLYELNVIGVNSELQKSSNVKVKFRVECFVKSSSLVKTNNSLLKFSLFESLPNRTQIGTLKSVCSDMNYIYELNEDYADLKICDLTTFEQSDTKACQIFNLDLLKSSENLFSLDLKEGYLMTNQVINLKTLANLIKDGKICNISLNDDDIFEFNSFSVLLKSKTKSLINMNLISNHNIEIAIQNSPRLFNFYDSLIVSDSKENNSMTSSSSSSNCIYNYNFSMEQHFGNVPDVRFIRLNENSVQSEAEFKFSECSASFYIHNDGCLSINTNNLMTNTKCLKSNQNNIIILNAGSYNILFKICYYDKNKVSCSPFYNQTILIEKNLYNGSILNTRLINTEQNFYEQLNSTKLKVFKLLQNSNQSIILLVLSVVVLVLALIAILTAIYYFFRIKLKREKNLNCEKVFVLPSSSETSSDSGMVSQMHSSSNTPETSSNATDSSKLSKTDDENDEIMKIQVSDDYFTKNSNPKYDFPAKNFSYTGTGSLCSMNSSCESNVLDEFRDMPILKPLECNVNNQQNEHGLYSVKNASIHINSAKNEPVSNLVVMSYEACPYILNTNEKSSIDYGNYYGTSMNENQNNAYQIPQIPQIQTHSKVNSLRQLKKDSALKKQTATSSYISLNLNNRMMLNNNQQQHHQQQQQQHQQQQNHLDSYFNSRDVLINQDEIIASVV